MKKITMHMLLLLSMLALHCAPLRLPEKAQIKPTIDPFEVNVKRWIEVQTPALLALDDLKKNSSLLLKTIKDMDPVCRIAYYSDTSSEEDKKEAKRKCDEESKRLYAANPWVVLPELYKIHGTGKWQYITDESMITKAIDKTIVEIRKTSPSICIEYINKKPVYSNNCREAIKECSERIGSDNGELYYNRLTEEFGVRRVPINSFDDYLNHMELRLFPLFSTEQVKADEQTRFLYENFYYGCKVASLVGVDFETKAINVIEIKDPPWTNYWDITYSNTTGIEKGCFLKPGQKAKLSRLHQLSSTADYKIKIWKENREKIVKENRCGEAISERCKNSYVVKGKIIYAYLTTACTIREVTRIDIASDIEKFRKQGITDAEITKHSTLMDTIDFCQKAHSAGYLWDYINPEVEKDCKNK